MQYINPFEVLNLNSENLSEINVSVIKKATKKLFAEIELSDSASVLVNGYNLTKTDCISILADLDDDTRKKFHFFILKNKNLNDFLKDGNLNFFREFKIENIYMSSDFVNFISPYFSFQYDKQLTINVKKRLTSNVKLILSLNPSVIVSDQELCYKGTYLAIKEIENKMVSINIDILNKTSPFIQQNFVGLNIKILENIDIEIINSLPIYFQSIRNNIADKIRLIAIKVNNKPYNNYKSAYQIIEISKEIISDGLIYQKVLNDFSTLKSNYESTIKKEEPKVITVVNTKIESTNINQKKITPTVINYIENSTYIKFILTYSIILLLSLFFTQIHPIILSISLIYTSFRFYEVFKIRNSKKFEEVEFEFIVLIASTIIICYGFSSIKAANFYIYFALIMWVHRLICVIFFKNQLRKEKHIYFIGALLINFLIIPFLNKSNVPKVETISKKNKNVSTNPVSNKIVEEQPSPEINYNYINVSNGVINGCSNIKSKYNYKINNKLIITCGRNADVAVKLIDYSTNNSIRYVYISKNSTYTIRNIPEGKYYLKIAYGNNWAIKDGESVCEGRFTKDKIFKKGENILNYKLIYLDDGSYQIPSFSLKLDVTFTERNITTFNSDKINENEFYNE
jgi:hypothetical protein